MSTSLKRYQDTCKEIVAKSLGGKRRVIVHVRDKCRRIVATLLAVRENNIVHVGWSKCNKADPFNRSVGIVKAYRRRLPLEQAEKLIGKACWNDEDGNVPNVVRRSLPDFLRRVRERDRAS